MTITWAAADFAAWVLEVIGDRPRSRVAGHCAVRPAAKHSVLHPLEVRGDAQAGNGKTLAPTCELLRRDVRQTKAVVFDFAESRGG